MVVRIAPSGGRTRRKGGAVSLAGADVPVVTPARDPGLNVPLIPISGGEVGGVVGRGLQSLGNVLDQGADLALQMVQRNEGLARDTDETSYSDTLQDTIRDLQATADLSDSALVEAVGEKMFQEKQRILSEHKGGKMSSTLLDNRLTKMHNRFADTLAVLNINAADVRLNLTIDRKISSITRDVLTDPDVLMSEDPLEAFRFHVGQLEEEIDFLELRPDQARKVRQVGRSEIALSMITPLIKNGQFERAKVLLRSDEMAEVLSPGQHRDAIQRVIDSERTLGEAKSEADELMEMARVLNPPEATDDEIRKTARKLKSIGDQNNVQLFEINGKIIAVNKDTNEVTTVMSGPTIEEEAERKKALTIADISGRFEVLSKMAKGFGLGELFGEPSAPAGDKEGAPQPAKPTSTEKEGEPTSPEVVPPLPKEAITNPFGSEEPPASDDMQKVLGLMALSRALLIIGETASANGFLSQARMIIDNSPEIQRAKELDKLIGNTDLLSMTGQPIGSTFRDLVGRTLPSPDEVQARKQRNERVPLEIAREKQVPVSTTFGELAAIQADRARQGDTEETGVPLTAEERARRISLESARAKDQAKAEVQMRFVFETHQQITDILEEIEDDPTLVGTVGSWRATGRKALTLLADLGFDNFVDAARDLAADNSDLGVDEVFDLFDDPLLSALELLSNSIGINRARITIPTGRLPIDIIKRKIADSNLTKFGGSQPVIDRLNRILEGETGRRRDALERQFPGMFNPFPDEVEEEAPEEQVIPSGISEFRLEGGKFVPVIPDEAPGGGSPEIPFSSTDSLEEISGSEGTDELRGEPSNMALETILVPNASGESTVDETVAAVDQLFGEGEFLKRVAKAESNFGTAKGTFRKSGDRGIWQLNQKTGFKRTKDVKAHPRLEQAYAKIREEFGIDWNEVSFEDLEKPLISALAARLFLLTIPEKIPGSLEEQAKYWKKYYNTVKGKGTIKKFIKDNSTEVEG